VSPTIIWFLFYYLNLSQINKFPLFIASHCRSKLVVVLSTDQRSIPPVNVRTGALRENIQKLVMFFSFPSLPAPSSSRRTGSILTSTSLGPIQGQCRLSRYVSKLFSFLFFYHITYRFLLMVCARPDIQQCLSSYIAMVSSCSR
jgi:hypothetical protein